MACQFNCTFCSSNKIAKSNTLFDLNNLIPTLKNYDVGTIIVNGGDPLMVSPSYYFYLEELLEKYNQKSYVCLTTNLWDYHLNPDKWRPLFSKKRFKIMNSFQYGNERLKPDYTPYTEADLRAIAKQFYDDFGEVFSFLSVTTENNEDYVLDTVRLAKELNTICRANPAVQSGRSTTYYPLYKMYNHYIDIYEAGLAKYEFNTGQIFNRLLKGNNGVCPWNRSCLQNIRCFSPEGLVHPCGAFGDNHYNSPKTYELSEYKDDEIAKDYPYIKSECLLCEHYLLCNSCYKTIHDIKLNHDEDKHCFEMKKVLTRLR